MKGNKVGAEEDGGESKESQWDRVAEFLSGSITRCRVFILGREKRVIEGQCTLP